MDALWEIKRIMDNPAKRLYIYINKQPEPKLIQGFISADTTSFATSASYSEIADLIQEFANGAADLAGNIPGAGKFIEWATKGIGMADKAAGLIGKGKTVAGSIKKWDGSSAQIPPIQMTFVALKPEDRPQDDAAELLAMCLPGKPFVSDNSDSDIWFWAPNGYSPAGVLKDAVSGDGGTGWASGLMGGLGFGGEIEGTCMIQIGEWFQMDGLLPESAQFEFSKEVTKAGNPLYVTGTVSFTTYRDIKASEYLTMFNVEK